MTEFTINITKRPLGIQLTSFDQNVVGVDQVLPNSVADKLGLLAGDILIAINNECILDTKASTVVDTFSKQSLPFHATFERFSSDYEDSSDSDSHPDLPPDIDDVAVIQDHILSNSNHKPLHDDITTGYDNYSDNMDDNISECSLSFDSPQDICSLNKYKDSSNTIVIKPWFHFFAEPDNNQLEVCIDETQCREPSVSRPLGVVISPKDVDDFVFTNDPDTEQLGTPYKEIDISTKSVVNGFIRVLLKNNQSGVKDVNILISQYLFNNVVMFDKSTICPTMGISGQRVITISDNGFNFGVHEWEIKIKKSDVHLQEIGVISTNNISSDMLSNIGDEGITACNILGARAVYGNELMSGTNYYASYNDNGQARCHRDLSQMTVHKIGWCQGDVIKVTLNLRKGLIRFWLNNMRVRKKISLQKNKTYYPFIGFAGNCEYELISYS